MRQLAFAAALLLSLPALAFAQDAATMSPTSPNASSQMPQPENSLPSGAATSMPTANSRTMHHHVTRHHRRVRHHARPAM